MLVIDPFEKLPHALLREASDLQHLVVMGRLVKTLRRIVVLFFQAGPEMLEIDSVWCQLRSPSRWGRLRRGRGRGRGGGGLLGPAVQRLEPPQGLRGRLHLQVLVVDECALVHWNSGAEVALRELVRGSTEGD